MSEWKPEHEAILKELQSIAVKGWDIVSYIDKERKKIKEKQLELENKLEYLDEIGNIIYLEAKKRDNKFWKTKEELKRKEEE